MPPLNTAVPFEQMNIIPMLVAEQLNLYMFGIHQIFFDKYFLVPEKIKCLTSYSIIQFLHLLSTIHLSHPFSTSPCSSFQKNRISDFICNIDCVSHGLYSRR